VTLGTIRGLTRHNYLLLTEFRLNVTRCLLGAASVAAVVAILETELFNVGTDGADSAPSSPSRSRPASPSGSLRTPSRQSSRRTAPK
jgi:hypothetical protein